jgi:hypothetical protein
MWSGSINGWLEIFARLWFFHFPDVYWNETLLLCHQSPGGGQGTVEIVPEAGDVPLSQCAGESLRGDFRMFSHFFLLFRNLLYSINTPLAPTLPPLGRGRLWFLDITWQIQHLRNREYGAILTGGAAAAGAKPPRASDGKINGFLQSTIFQFFL